MVEINSGGITASSERIPGKTDAEKLRSSCVGQSALMRSVERQEKREKPPKLYDLTTLQRRPTRITAIRHNKR